MKYTVWLKYPIRTGKEDIYSIHEVDLVHASSISISIKDKTIQEIPWSNIASLETILEKHES